MQELKIKEIPSSLAVGFLDNNDVRILSINQDVIIIENDLDFCAKKVNFTIYLNNVIKDRIEKFIFEDCEINKIEQDVFSIKISIKINNYKEQKEYQYCVQDIIDIININNLASGSIFAKQKATQLINEKIKNNTKLPSILELQCFSKNYEEHEKEWYNFELTQEINNNFSAIIKDLEFAFSIDNASSYKFFNNNSFKEKINEILALKGIINHGLFTKNFTRVYIGNEFCPNKLPKIKDLINLINKLSNQGLQITVALPFLTEGKIVFFQELINSLENWCNVNNKRVEVIINDLGILNIINQKIKYIKLILGRLLNKRTKGLNPKWKIGFSKHEKELEENNLNSNHMQKFLQRHNINRFEFDCNNILNKVIPDKSSLHFPYYQINTAEFCHLYADIIHHNIRKQTLINNCPQYCIYFSYLYPKILNYIGRGNSVFGYNKEILHDPSILSYYKNNGVNRLVYSI